ncbi:MAG TPA: response regulator [Polyangia bacterium]|nr:response regulator [Polyangia bacterium]
MDEPPDVDLPPLLLVVEDLEEAYDLFSQFLADAGFRVVGACNGIDAIDSAVRLLPDAILMDLSLPRMGGCEAAKLLKQDERTSHIPIVAVTAHEDLADIARESGCDAFFTKPCPLDRLLDRVRALVYGEVETPARKTQLQN